MLYKLLGSMDRRRFDPLVVSLTRGGALAPSIAALGIPVLEPSPSSVRKIQTFRPDILQGWMYHGNLAAQAMAVLLPAPVPVLWNVRGSHHILGREKLHTAIAIWLNARLARLPYRIVNNSASSAQLHERHLGFPPGRWEIIPNGFDPERFRPSESARREIREELHLPPAALLIGLIGRYHAMKDHSNFVTAAGLLGASEPEAHFVMAGRGVDRNNAVLTGEIRAARVAGRTSLLGARGDIPRVMAALDIATSSSFSEGFPNVVGEAMCCGVPCVVTDVGDSARLVGDTGLVVPARAAAPLAAAWRDLISRGRQGRLTAGSAGRARIASHFSIAAVAARYERLYDRALESGKRNGDRQCAA
jgi:glycosyltransferase involved in cell wall biosynthesis